MTTLDIIVPVYNEKIETVQHTIGALKKTFSRDSGVSLIVVDDGSREEFHLDQLAQEEGITFVRHESNQGYGAALKTGIRSGSGEYIGIIDADGTYPIDEFPLLTKHLQHHDMVVGIRTGEVREIPVIRRFPKYMLNLLASYMAGVPIRDLNSGMRIFSRELSYHLWYFFPKGFSFTSTITMGATMGGFRVKEVPINYFKRTGQSSIHPIKDTVRFFKLVCRLGLLFYPMKVFGPVASLLFLIGFVKGFLVDYHTLGYVGNFSVTIMLAAVQIFMTGLIGTLIVQSRFLKPSHLAPEMQKSEGGSSSGSKAA